MMLNLFSVFDPHMSFYALNWISSLSMFFLMPLNYWLFFSRWTKGYSMLMTNLWKEFTLILHSKFNIYNILVLMTLILFILVNNFMGLFPYIFTSTSHLIMPLMFSFSMWMGLMLFGWLKNTNFMFSHLVPLGTPYMLMFFMVLIETLSNLIRPLTLAIRLVANMIAGHLLLTLLSSLIPTIMTYPIMLFTQLLLFSLESAVSIIQSYVFVILMTLYFKETN